MCTRTGFSLFIGYINLICNGFGLILCTVILARKQIIHRAIENGTVQDISVNTVRSIVVVALIVFGLMTIISGFLVTGIIKRRHRYMRPWLLLAFINIVVTLIIALFSLFFNHTHYSRFTSCMIVVAVQALVFQPMYSLYKDFREENKDIIGRA